MLRDLDESLASSLSCQLALLLTSGHVKHFCSEGSGQRLLTFEFFTAFFYESKAHCFECETMDTISLLKNLND